MNALQTKIRNFLKEEEGASAVEYGVLVALIIAVAIVMIGNVGTKVNSAFTKVDTAMPK